MDTQTTQRAPAHSAPSHPSLRARLLYPLLFVAAAFSLLLNAVASQTLATQPVRLVTQYAPGGGADLIARILTQELPSLLGRPVILESRPGASGAVANSFVASAAPDGLTLLLSGSGAITVNPHLGDQGAVSPVKEFTPIALVSRTDLFLVINSNVPARNVQELTALAKAKPGTLNYASSGTGTAPHLAAELYKKMAGVDIVHVPYKGSGPTFVDLAGGRTQLTFTGIGIAAPFLKSGQLRAIASSGKARSALMPEVPTMAESGMPGFEAEVWYALLGPGNMPSTVVEPISAAVRTVMAKPSVREQLLRNGSAAAADNTPAQFSAFLQSEFEKWGRLIREVGIKGE